MAAAKKKSPSRKVEIPSEDEGLGFAAWAIGNRALRWVAGVAVSVTAIVIAWHNLDLPIMATRTFVHETVKPLDAGIKTLAVSSVQNRVETLSSRRASAQQAKSEKQLQLRVAKAEDTRRLLQEQIDGLEQQIKELDKQIEDLQSEIRRKP